MSDLFKNFLVYFEDFLNEDDASLKAYEKTSFVYSPSLKVAKRRPKTRLLKRFEAFVEAQRAKGNKKS